MNTDNNDSPIGKHIIRWTFRIAAIFAFFWCTWSLFAPIPNGKMMPLFFGITIPALPRTSDPVGILLFGVLIWTFGLNDKKTVPDSIVLVCIVSGLWDGISNGMIAGFTVTTVLSIFFTLLFLILRFIRLSFKYLWRTSKRITNDAVLVVSPAKDGEL